MGRSSLSCFVVAKGFAPSAFAALKERGVLPWTQAQLLGKKTADAIQQTLTVLEALVRQQDLDPHSFALIFDGLENWQDLFGNMKGKLFELLIGYIFQKRGYDTRLSWEVSEGPESYDVDLLGIRANTAVIVECKGNKEGIAVDYNLVKHHFNKRTPLTRLRLLGNSIQRVSRFESIVVTSGTFDSETEADLTSGTFAGRPDTSLVLWNRERLLEELQADGHHDLIEVVRKYYGNT